MPVRVAAINYLNTLPFMYGIAHSLVSEQVELVSCTPSRAAQMLMENKVDLGIVPVATLQSENLHIVSDYCIGAEGCVDSVRICSPCPIEAIHTLYLDEDSRTSAALTRLLAREYWNIDPEYHKFDFSQEKLDEKKSYLLIGDKALIHSHRFPYQYDLAEQWLQFTGKPFVFATWTANKNLPETFVRDFNSALAYGIQHIEDSVKEYYSFDAGPDPLCGISSQRALKYLRENISYDFNQDKKEGLLSFWNMIFSSSKFRVRW